jgi:hypothetical protein
MKLFRALALALVTVLLGAANPPPVSLSAAQRATLERYLGALQEGRYDVAFAQLTAAEQKYFGSAQNFASGFTADGLKIFSHQPVKVTPFKDGVIVAVVEKFQFTDQGLGVPVKGTGRVDYGLLNEGGGVRVKDPSHPWLAIAPKNATVTQNGLRVTVRKVSFFTGRVELVVTFANTADTTVTLLPYGRTVLRDAAGTVYRPIVTDLPGLTDRNLRLGLRLPSDAQYTGALTFATPDRFTPSSLNLALAPQLRDGADDPFEVDVPIAWPS